MSSSFLVLGATCRTGRHFLALALEKGHRVKVLARDPSKISLKSDLLEVHERSITDQVPLDDLLQGVSSVVAMLGNAKLQSKSEIAMEFVQRLVPAMRRQGVAQLLDQAGGLTRAYKERLPISSWLIRNTLARFKGLIGQHEDNEAVIRYLVEEAKDLTWVVHRASLYGNGPSKVPRSAPKHV